MDRRMYRGVPGSTPYQRVAPSPYKPMDSVCGDIVGGYGPDACERDCYDFDGGCFDRCPLAMAYVPWQHFKNLYDNEFTALARGTIFKELDLEFYGRSCK